MESKVKKISIFLFIFVLITPLFGQEKTKFTQKLEWSEDEAAFKYKVEVRLLGTSAKEEGDASVKGLGTGSGAKSEFYQTVDNFIELTLSAGNYEYRVYAYDFLGKEASVSEWVKFSVIRAKTPVIKDLKTDVVVSGSSHITFDIPLDVSSITEDTQVELINSKTKERIKGHLDITEKDGKIVASKAVFPEVSEGDWHAKVTNPSGLYTETPSIIIEKTVEEAKEVVKINPKRIYIPSETDKLDEEKRLKEIAEKEEAIRIAEEKKRLEEAEKIRLTEEKKRLEEEDAEAERIKEKKRLEEAEKIRVAEEKKRLEEEAAEAEKIRLAEEKRLEEEKRIAAEEERLRLEEEESRRKEELAYEKYLEDEKKRMEAEAKAERKRIEEELRRLEEEAKLREAEKRRLEDLASKEEKDTETRHASVESISKEVVALVKELDKTYDAISIAEATGSDEVAILEERVELLEERIRLAENAERLAKISESFSEKSLELTNALVLIADTPYEELATVNNLIEQKEDADNASLLAKEKFDSVEKERKVLDKKLKANQKSVDRRINKLLKSKKPVNNFNILVGGDALYNLYDKQLFSLIDYPVYGAGELQICWTPIHVKENLFGFNLDFEGTDIYSSDSNVSLHIPIVSAQLGLDYKQKIIADRLYGDFSISGGLTALGKTVAYDDDVIRENEDLHFYVYPCVSASAGIYLLPAKHFALETGAKVSHKFVVGMPTGTAEAYLLFGLRL